MSSRITPPSWMFRFLRLFCPDHLVEEIEGDLIERYRKEIQNSNRLFLNTRLALSIVGFLRPGILFRNKFKNSLINTIMWKSYFLTALRSFRMRPSNTILNVLGLVIGTASALIIFSIVKFEYSFDRFHSEAERIYRLVRVSEVEGQTEYRTGVVYPLPSAMKNEIADLENITSVLYWGWSEVQVEVMDENDGVSDLFKEANGFALVEPEFFSVFDFGSTGLKWINGSPQTALGDPFSVVLDKSTAKKYFGEESAIGKTLRLDTDMNFTVSGVVEDLPANTDFPFRIMASYSTLYEYIGERANEWVSVGSNECYLKLKPDVLPEDVDVKVAEIHKTYAPESISSMRNYVLQPLPEVHSDQRFGNYNRRFVSKNRLITISVIGLFLLLTACINYINLSTAQITLRSKEIGVRKVLGSNRSMLIGQFVTETFLLSLFSGIIALIIAGLLISFLGDLLTSASIHTFYNDPYTYQVLLISVLLVTIVSGIYPALMASGFNSIQAIKNKIKGNYGGTQLRKLLVIIQFSITQIFLIGTFVVFSQAELFNKMDLGFDKEAIINVELTDNDPSKAEQFSQVLTSYYPDWKIGFSSTLPAGIMRPSDARDIKRKSSQDGFLVYEYQSVDTSYLSVYGIALTAGRNFFSSDTAGQIIINQTLARKAGFTSADEAVGSLMVNGAGDELEIIGVMHDYHSGAFRSEIDKIALSMNPNNYFFANIKLPLGQDGFTANNMRNSLETIKNAWIQVYPESAFGYRFFDDNVEAMFREDQKFSYLMQVFSLVLLVIGCLGLYGMVSFVVNRKMKEVAVRKVFGATLTHILNIITKDYIILILVSFVIASPVAYYYMNEWLNDFVYKIEIKWWFLVLPLIVVLLVAILAISGQSIKAIKSNPANILKHE